MTARACEDICARCENLTTKGYPKEMAQGKGRCVGYDIGFAQLRDPFVSWNQPSCIRFAKADDLTARERWIGKWQAREDNDNEAQPKTKG